MKYVLLVGGGYGATIIDCMDDAVAEEARKIKANWEGAVALIRPATEDEVASGTASQCWNHPGFKNTGRYQCECGKCD